MTLDKFQNLAVGECINPSVSKIFITGGGGTGKSAILRIIVDYYNDVTVLAPTNSASKNIKGMTIHKHYKISPSIDQLADNEDDVVSFNFNNFDLDSEDDEKVIIIDEISMVDEYMMLSIVDKINPDLLILFGDPNQLPPPKGVKVDWSEYCDKTYTLHTNFRTTNQKVADMVDKFSTSNKLDSIPIFNGDFDKNTIFIAFKNSTLSNMQKDLLGYSGGKKGDKVITFGGVSGCFDNGDTLTLDSLERYFSVDGLQKWNLKENYNTKYPPHVITGNYKTYKDKLQKFHRIAKRVVWKLSNKYEVEERALNSIKDKLTNEEQDKLKGAWRDYYQIKNSPFARHNQFITTYKAQGKGYMDVVVNVKDMPNKEHVYTGLSRVQQKLRIYNG